MSDVKVKSLTVRTSKESYPFVVGIDLAAELVTALKAEGDRRIAVISDTTTESLHGNRVLQSLKDAGLPAEIVSFESGEKNKNQATVTALQNALSEKAYGRDSIIIALGGGVVGDVAGFVAATYMRGVPYIQMPTTLLAMVDSSVGGKVGVDTEDGKNMIGAFYQPRAVIADLSFIATLKKEQVVNGLIEAIKTFFTSDKDALQLVEQLDLESPTKDPLILQEIIVRSVRIKAGLVERDEKEAGERKIINFGHTIGNAIERVSNYEIAHGYAVGYGILVETKVAEQLGSLSASDRATAVKYLERFGITSDPIRKFATDDIIAATKRDKKVLGGKSYYVLLDGIGSVSKKDGRFAHPVDDDAVRKALESLR